MTTTINASPSNGLVQTADGSGILKVQSNGVTTNALAWVNFNGNTAAIRSSYNVSSVTRNSAGDYTVNFSSALSDANFSASAFNMDGGSGFRSYVTIGNGYATTYFKFIVITSASAYSDPTSCGVVIFGN